MVIVLAKSQGDKIRTGLAGEYYVAAELCRRGHFASLTLKNYPQVDIFALNPDTLEQTAIQVKTIRNRGLFFVPENAADHEAAFVFVVIHDESPSYDVFILTGDEVSRESRASRARYMAAPHRRPIKEEDQPLTLSVHELEPYRDRWQLIFPSQRHSA